MAGRILTDDGGRALDSNGNPISGAKLKAFVAGTTTPVSLYTTRDLGVAHASPVVANSAGFFAQMWATDNQLLDIKLYSAADVTYLTPLRTFLNVTPQGPGGVVELASASLLLDTASSNYEIKLTAGATYELTSLVNLSALQGRRIYLNGATMTAAVGFTGTHMLSISGDTQLIGPGTIDGTNVPAPVGVTSYTQGSYAGTGIFITGTGDRGRIEGITFQNFPSGPILHDSATTRDGFPVLNCYFHNNQTYTAAETNGVVHMHGVTRGLMLGNNIAVFNWKGYYYAAGSLNQMAYCHAVGGTDGMASHYLNSSPDSQILDSSHTGVSGVGFGIKASNCQRPKIRNFTSLNARSALYLQGCDDLDVDSVVAINPTISGVLVEGSTSYGAATRGMIRNVRVRRKVLGSTVNDIGIRIEATTKLSRTVTAATKANPVVITTSTGHTFKEDERVYFSGVGGMTQLNGNNYRVRNPATTTFELYTDTGPLDGTGFGTFTSGGTASCGGEVDRLTIRDSHFENCFHGISAIGPGFQQTNIDILDNDFVNCGQYCIVGYIGSGRVMGNRIGMDGASVLAAFNLTSDGVTTGGLIEFSGNQVTGCTGDVIQIAEGGALSYRAIRILNNGGDGGVNFLDYQGNAHTTDIVNVFEVRGNEFTGLTNGCTFAFNGTTATRLRNEGNSFLNSSYVPVADTYTSTSNLSIVGSLRHSGTPESVFAAPVGTIFHRTDGGAGTSLYVKESGTGSTGWVGK